MKKTIMNKTFLFIFLSVNLFLSACSHTPPQVTSPVKSSSTFAGLHEEGYFKSRQGYRIYHQMWCPTNRPKGVIVWAHGTLLHSGSYWQAGEFFANNGYCFHGVDLRGWGLSEGRGRRGYVASHHEYLEDMNHIIHNMRKRFPDNMPVYTGGESLGGTVALLGNITGKLQSDGLILSAPGVYGNPRIVGMRAPRFIMPLAEFSGAMFGRLLPNYPLIPPYINSGIREPARKEVKNDPYVTHRFIPAGYVTALVNSWHEMYPDFERIKTPMLITHGERDNLIPAYGIDEVFERAGSKDKTLLRYKGTYHTTFLDPDSPRVFADVLSWLNAHKDNNKIVQNRYSVIDPASK